MSNHRINPQIRVLHKSDVAACLRLSEAAGWNQNLWDWETIIGAPGSHLAALIDEKIIGTIASLDYGKFSWLAMVLVDPQLRRRGIATLLLEKILDKIPDAIFRLDATPEGAKVYQKLGFHPVDEINRWHYQGLPKSQIVASTFIHKTSINLEHLKSRDQHVFGANRSGIISAIVSAYPTLVIEDKKSESYLLGREGKNAWQIGPIISQNVPQSAAMVRQTLSAFPEQSFYLDSFINQKWHEELENMGFIKERELYRMQKGNYQATGNRANQFAIAGPELG